MALRIFENDPDSAPQKASDDIVGRFRSGMQVNDRPMALDAWRITTGDPDVAAAVAEAFGGSPEEWETKTEERLQVLTEASEVDIILPGTKSIVSEMVLWGRNGKIRSCDGVQQKDDEGTPCACPNSLKDRKDAAKQGHGCEPSVGLYFHLADHVDLGRFKFFSGSWNLATDIGKAEAALAKIEGPTLATLRLEPVEFEAKTGPRAGQMVSFTKPVVDVKGPAPKGILDGTDAEDPFEEPF